MKFTVGRQQFANAIAMVLPAITKSNTKPILACVLVDVSEGSVEVSGTDIDLGIKVISGGEPMIEETGSVCVDAQILHKMLLAMEGDVVGIWTEGDSGHVYLKCGNTRHSMVYIPRSEFPPFPNMPGNGAQMDARLTLALSIANIAVPEQEMRMYSAPAGALVAATETGMEVVATDGHRLIHIPVDTAWPFGGTRRIIIPKKFIPMLGKVASPCMVATDGNILALSGGVSMFCRLKDPTYFPEYRDAINNAPAYGASFDKKAVSQGLRRVAITAEECIVMKFVDNSIRMTSENISVGSSSDMVVSEYDGPEIDIGVNQQYLQDFISAMPDGKVGIYITDSESIIWVKGEGVVGTFLMMPVRL